MIVFSPLEQFSILKIVSLHVGSLDFSFTNSSFLAITASLLAFLFFSFASDKASLLPGP
jgi:hypothetical protein